MNLGRSKKLYYTYSTINSKSNIVVYVFPLWQSGRPILWKPDGKISYTHHELIPEVRAGKYAFPTFIKGRDHFLTSSSEGVLLERKIMLKLVTYLGM